MGHTMNNSKQTKKKLLLGAHVSIAGGFKNAIERGESIGCTCIQIFTKSNKQWRAKPITEKEAHAFKAAWKSSSIEDIIVHSSYLINIGSPNPTVAKKSTEALTVELKRCEQLGIKHLVLHPGAHLASDEKESLERIARNLDLVFEQTSGSTMILLETMAGQGTMLGYTFEQLAHIYNHATNKGRIGYCFDTCHAYAAGYKFDTPEHYEAMWNDFDRMLGLHKLKAFHINDSKKDRGSRVDRHEDISKGKVGKKAFELLFNDPRFFNVPKILETPKESLEDDARNMETIKLLITDATKKILDV